jgi:hypothetical protein
MPASPLRREQDVSPLLLAKIGGALYVLIIVLGTFEEAFVRNRIVVTDDAAATAANSGRWNGCGASESLRSWSCLLLRLR